MPFSIGMLVFGQDMSFASQLMWPSSFPSYLTYYVCVLERGVGRVAHISNVNNQDMHHEFSVITSRIITPTAISKVPTFNDRLVRIFHKFHDFRIRKLYFQVQCTMVVT